MKAIILTASQMRKTIGNKEYSGKCITALLPAESRIVRLVSNRFGAPMESPWCNTFHPLDIVDLLISEECPLRCQTENVLSEYWGARVLGKYDDSMEKLYSMVNQITNDDFSFMTDGSYNKLYSIDYLKHSVEMIRVSNLYVVKDSRFDRTTFKCGFDFGGREFFNVSMTDPTYRDPSLFSRENRVDIGSAYLIISIPADCHTDGYFYKFAAAIFPIE